MKKVLKFSFVLIFLIILLIYVMGVIFFSKHFMPNTKINGKDLSLTKISNLHENYNNMSKDFNLNIIERDKEEIINSKDFEYKDYLDEKENVNQKYYYWFLYMLIDKDYQLKNKISYNEEKFNNIINNLNIYKNEVVEPKNAHIIFKDGNFQIEKEVYGNKINKYLFSQKVLEYIKSGKNKLDLEEENIYYSPEIFSNDKDLNNILNQKNMLNNFEITYNFKDRKEVLKNEKLVDLYKTNKDNILVPDINKARDYVIYLSGKYDTFKKKRTIYGTGIGFVEVTGGIYGWSTDIEKTTQELVKLLENTKSVTVEPVYRLTAMSRAKNDLGNSYVEIDLHRQHMWLYKDGNIVVEAPVVTGNPNKGNATPRGTGKIWSREKNRTLKGADWESYVNFWLPFNWSGCGIHDSSWRGDYGKNIYKSNGSHGCVNTPPQLMEKFYSNTFQGMPVIVYDSSIDKVN
ncbi:MAG: L,D-transpeptidase family protein [Peptoniphilaceae bacterium]